MATVAEIIAQAYREGNFIAAGEEPTPEEVAEALPRLNGLLSSLFGVELGEGLRDWYAPTTLTDRAPLRALTTPGGAAVSGPFWQHPPPNVRLLLALTEDAAVFFPPAPNDGARMALVDVGSTAAVTLSGNGRRIEGFANIIASPSDLDGRTWLYRADLGNWIRLTTLGEDDQLPLPAEFDDFSVCGLAIRLAPRYGVTIAGETAEMFARSLSNIKKRYKQTSPMPSSDVTAPTMRSEI